MGWRRIWSILFTASFLCLMAAPFVSYFGALFPDNLTLADAEGIEYATSIASDFSSQMTSWAMAAMAAHALLIVSGGGSFDVISRLMFVLSSILLLSSIFINVMLISYVISEAINSRESSYFSNINRLMWIQFIVLYEAMVFLVANFFRNFVLRDWL